jgi:hypothetical protein
MVEQKDAVNPRPQRSKHLLTAMNEHTTIEELLEAVFSVLSMLKLYNKLDSNKETGHGLKRFDTMAVRPTDRQMSLDFSLSEVHRLLQIKCFGCFPHIVASCYSCSN